MADGHIPQALIAAAQAALDGERSTVGQHIFSAAPDGILLVSAQSEICQANPAIQRLSGYTPQELIGQRLDILLPESARAHHARWVGHYFQSPRPRPMGSVPGLSLRHRDGHLVEVDIALGVCHLGQQPYAVAFLRDVSEAHRMADALRYQATYDALTGLYNRSQFMLMLEVAAAQASRKGCSAAVLLLDLDDFKGINDHHGHAAGRPVRVAVNLSPQQFRLKDLPRRVAELLDRHRLAPAALELEVTESQAMVNPLEARQTLHALAEMGVTLALDDFGTGHSSLAQLKRLPVHRIKIDREFVRDLPHDDADVALVRGMVALAHSLGLQVVAEGVEFPSQWELVQRCGVQDIQGWLIARAMPAHMMSEMLSQGPELIWVKHGA